MLDLEAFIRGGGEWVDLTPVVAPDEPSGCAPDSAEVSDVRAQELGGRLRALGRGLGGRTELVRVNHRDRNGALRYVTWKARLLWSNSEFAEDSE